MADPRFFSVAKPMRLAELARLSGAELADSSRGDVIVRDVAPLDAAGPDHLTFLDNRKYLDAFKTTRAGACFVRAEMAEFAPSGTAVLVSLNPYKAYALAALAFYPEPAPMPGQGPGAVVDVSASLGEGCEVGPYAVIGAHVKIGKGCRIGAGAVICEGVEIGDNCDIGARAYVTHSLIGNRVRLYPGACIGRAGFGFAIDKTGFTAVPQLGRVIVEDDVEIGANTTVDRGAGPDTIIGQGTRIDNLVQIGHNVRIGKYCVIVAQVGISGSTQVGDFTMLGGQAGVAGHLKIGAGAKVAAQSGVMRDVPDGAEVVGFPAMPMRQYFRQTNYLARMVAAKKGEKDD